MYNAIRNAEILKSILEHFFCDLIVFISHCFLLLIFFVNHYQLIFPRTILKIGLVRESPGLISLLLLLIIYIILIGNLTSGKGPHMTKSTLIVPQDEFSQWKLLAQYPQRYVKFKRVYFSLVSYIFTTAMKM